MANNSVLFTFIICACWYLIVCFLITRIKFFKESGLNKWWLIGLYSIKVAAGFAYAFFYLQPAYYATSDTWHYFELSKSETDWLLSDPLAFLADLFNHGYNNAGNLFLGQHSYWNDLKSNVLIKLIAISNVFTFKNYFGNIFLFNFLFFFGPVALYRLIQQIFSADSLLSKLVVFFIPSFLFWCSGLHKDGIIFTFTAVIVYHFYLQLTQNKFCISSIAWMLTGLVIIFSLRNFVALLMTPSLVVWCVAVKKPRRAFITLILIYGIGLTLFFISGKIATATDFPQYIIDKQNEFKQLSGTSAIPVPILENSVTSYMKFFPTAVDIGFFRPHITEGKNISYIPSALEMIFLWSIILLSLLINSKLRLNNEQKAFVFFALCFGVTFLILAGYTITFSGAIVRYRSIALPFIAAAFLPWINGTWISIHNKVRGNKA